MREWGLIEGKRRAVMTDKFSAVRPDRALHLSPTDISQFIRLEQCERYLRLRLHERGVNANFMRQYGVAPVSVTPLLTRSGAIFEQRGDDGDRRPLRDARLRGGARRLRRPTGEQHGGSCRGARPPRRERPRPLPAAPDGRVGRLADSRRRGHSAAGTRYRWRLARDDRRHEELDKREGRASPASRLLCRDARHALRRRWHRLRGNRDRRALSRPGGWR